MCTARSWTVRRGRWRIRGGRGANRDGEAGGWQSYNPGVRVLPERPIMNSQPLSEFRRRDVLRLAGSAAAVLALAASPLAALAQTAPGGATLKIATIGAGREGGAP